MREISQRLSEAGVKGIQTRVEGNVLYIEGPHVITSMGRYLEDGTYTGFGSLRRSEYFDGRMMWDNDLDLVKRSGGLFSLDAAEELARRLEIRNLHDAGALYLRDHPEGFTP